MAYRLKIYDNFHYMDENEAYVTGFYEHCEGALLSAQLVVTQFLEAALEQNPELSAEELLGMYRSFGEDPVIISDAEGDVPCGFSAWSFAEGFVQDLIARWDSQSHLAAQVVD